MKINFNPQTTSTVLVNAGVYTGASLTPPSDATVFSAGAFSDKASATNGFKIQGSIDGTTWFDITSASVTASTYSGISTASIWPYMRVVYTNGATTQTSFQLSAVFL